MKKTDNNLWKTIILSSIILALALVYLATNLWGNKSNNVSDAEISRKVEEWIQAYVEKQQQVAAEQQETQKQNNNQRVEVSVDDDAVLWDPDAPVTIIEFSDYECPFCKRHYIQTLPDIKENYVDKWLVKIVFRDFPLWFHDPLATQQAIAAECAREQWGDDVYYEYHDLIYDNTTSNWRWMEKSKLYDLADQLNLDSNKFATCLDEEKYKDEVMKDLADWQKYGITGTPWFFINGRPLKWAYPYSEFKRIIDEELAK